MNALRTRNTGFSFAFLLALSLFISPAFAQNAEAAPSTPALLKNVNANTESSYGYAQVEFQGKTWFTGCTPKGSGACEEHKLYTTDGTESGTHAFEFEFHGQPVPDPDPYGLTVFNDELYFVADGADGVNQLWKTDGTVEGTVVVYELEDESVDPRNFTIFNNSLYFTARDEGEAPQLMKTDGSDTAPTVLSNFSTDDEDNYPIYGLTVSGGHLFFGAESNEFPNELFPSGAGYQLYKVNDAEDGVDVVDDFTDPDTYLVYGPDSITDVNGTLYFTAYLDDTESPGFRLYKYYDVGEGNYEVALVKQISTNICSFHEDNSDNQFDCYNDTDDDSEEDEDNQGQYPTGFANINGSLFFLADNGAGSEPWISDGTDEGTHILTDVDAAGGEGYLMALDTASEPNKLYYYTEEEDNGSNDWTLRITDGNVMNDITIPTPNGYPNSYGVMFNGSMYFSFCTYGDDDVDDDCELWRVNDAKNGIQEVKDINPYSSSYAYPSVVSGGSLYIEASDGVHGTELWKSDGTSGGTQMVLDLNTKDLSSDVEDEQTVAMGGNGYFPAYENQHGVEIWKTDGTESGTVLLKDINEGFDGDDARGSDPQHITALGNEIYFVAGTEEYGRELWKSDGTTGGTSMVEDTEEGEGDSSPHNLTVLGDTLYFLATINDDDTHLYSITSGGEPEVVSGMSSIDNMVAVGDTLYLTGSNGDGGGIWKLQEGGSPTLIQGFDSGSIPDGGAGDTTLYFNASDGEQDGVWKIVSGGTPVFTGAPEVSTNITVGDALYYFSNPDSDTVLSVIKPGMDPQVLTTFTSGDSPSDLVVVGDTIFFSLYDADHGTELWKATAEGASMVEDINVGSDGSNPSNLVAAGNTLYFRADDGVHGTELWKSDGTEEGTVLVDDLYPGVDEENDDAPNSGDPRYMAVVGTSLLFYAKDQDAGYEPWIITGLDISTDEDDGDDDSEDPEPEEESHSSSGHGHSGSSVPSRTPGTQTGTTSTTTSAPASTGTLTRDLQLSSTGSDVKELQKFLNTHGFVITPAGAGSPGNETELFGALTKAALIKFQIANNISPASGYFGPLTRAFIAGAPSTTDAPVTTATTETPVSDSVRDLDVGMSGDDVKGLQTILIGQNYVIPAGATGFFAEQTKSALAKYQSEHAITPAEGYFGVKTRTQMKAAELSGTWW